MHVPSIFTSLWDRGRWLTLCFRQCWGIYNPAHSTSVSRKVISNLDFWEHLFCWSPTSFEFATMYTFQVSVFKLTSVPSHPPRSPRPGHHSSTGKCFLHSMSKPNIKPLHSCIARCGQIVGFFVLTEIIPCPFLGLIPFDVVEFCKREENNIGCREAD
jgi:hypothetical protein